MIDEADVEKWLKIRALERSSPEAHERQAARSRREAMEARLPGLAAIGAAREAQAAGPPPANAGRPQAGPAPRPWGSGPQPRPWGAGPQPRPAVRPFPSSAFSGSAGPRPVPPVPPGAQAPPPPPAPPWPEPQAGPAPQAGPQAAPPDGQPRSRWAAAADFARSALGGLGLGLTLQQAVAQEVQIDLEENRRTVRIKVTIPTRLVEHVRASTGSSRSLVQLVALRIVAEAVEFLDAGDG